MLCFTASTGTAFQPSASVARCNTPSLLLLRPAAFHPIGVDPTRSSSRAHRHLQPHCNMASSSGGGGGNILSYQDFTEDLPSKSVIDAVETLATVKNNKIIASDVASTAGVSLSQARRDLTKLAALTLGDIAVSTDGELIYSFPSGRSLKSVLSANSLKYKIANVIETKIWPPLFYALRVSFGVALLVSIALIFTTIAFVSSSSSSDDDDRRDNRRSSMSLGYGGGPFGGGGLWGPSPFDFFFYRPYGYNYYSTRPFSLVNAKVNVNEPPEMGFLESVFSYIFGDGNPNVGIEEKRLQLASKVIRDNNGAVTAEQLAPFCDDMPLPTSEEEEEKEQNVRFVDERFVLPIVSKLGGEPQVTDEGDIIYVFPEMQLSAAESSINSALVLEKAGFSPDASAREIKRELELAGINTRGVLEKMDLIRVVDKALKDMGMDGRDAAAPVLQEREFKFSEAGDFQRVLAGGLGILNLFGALYLGNLLSSPYLYGVQLPAYFGVVQTMFPFLLSYAVLFNAIPLARSIWIKQENEKIQQRNKARRSWYTFVQSSIGRNSGRIAKKLRSAKSYGFKMKKLGKSDSDIVYDTGKSYMDAEVIKEKNVMQEFDQILTSNDEKK